MSTWVGPGVATEMIMNALLIDMARSTRAIFLAHDDFRSDWRVGVKFNHFGVEHADAAGRRRCADG